MSEWIDIDENPPPEDKNVLLYWVKSKHIEDGSIYWPNTNAGFRSHCLFDGEKLNDEPNYWMPRPEDPEDT